MFGTKAVQHPLLERTHSPTRCCKARHEVPHISQGAEMYPFKRVPTAFFRSFDPFTEARQNRPSCARRIPYKANEQFSMRLNAWDIAEVRREFKFASVRWSGRRNRTETRIDVQGLCRMKRSRRERGDGMVRWRAGREKAGSLGRCTLFCRRTWKRLSQS